LSTPSFVLPVRQTILTLVVVAIGFLVIDLAISLYDLTTIREIKKLLSITREGNLPTWFSSTLLLAVSVTAGMIGWRWKLLKVKPKTIGWFLISGFFLYMSIDDASRVHERVATAIKHAAQNPAAGGDPGWLGSMIMAFPSYTWQLVFMPLFGGFGLFMLVFLLRELNDRLDKKLFIAGLAFYVFAVAADFFDGMGGSKILADLVSNAYSPRTVMHLMRAYEEFIEMVGTTLFLAAFLRYWQASKDTPTN